MANPAPNLIPHSGLHFWGALAGRQHAWSSNLAPETDKLLFLLRLLCAAFWRDQLLRRPDRGLETQSYRSEVLKLTRERLCNEEEAKANSTIVVISMLAMNAVRYIC
jgi:hypothetical protein